MARYPNQEENKTEAINKERFQLLRRFEYFFETPMIVLGFVWIVLLILELIHKNEPWLETIGLLIWIVFIVDFLVKFTLAPFKIQFLKKNVLTVISLIIPAFRVFRILRVMRLFRVSRGLRLVKVLGSLNRGMRALGATMKRRAFGYVILLTIIVLFTGAAGMYAFEKDINDGMRSYGSALWWTGMILTTMGSESWPATAEGRILCVVLSIYAFAVFGYVTATIATFFIGRDAEEERTEIAGSSQIEELKKEILELKELIKNRLP